MDIYAIVCIFALVVQSVWHAIIGTIVFLGTSDNRLTPSMWFVYLDRYVFVAMIGFFITMHVWILFWLYMVPYRHRQNMTKKDAHYGQRPSQSKKGEVNESFREKSRKTSSFALIPEEKAVPV